MSRQGRFVVIGLVLVALLGATWYLVGMVRDALTPAAAAGPECVIQPAAEPSTLTVALADSTLAAGTSVEQLGGAVSLTAVQLQHASTINAVGLQRGLSDRARVIALATALQESSLRNLPNGDLDSVGLFQQRPSQGWGTAAQVGDPIYAAGKFYDALLEVPNWASLPLTEAAQEVQYSAFPDAYAKWEKAATLLSDALTAPPYPRVSCRTGATAPTADAPARPALDGATAASPELGELLADAAAELGGLTWLDGSTDSAAVFVALPDRSAADSAAALAFWAVAHSAGSDVASVEVAGWQWRDHSWSEVATPLPDGQVSISVATATAG